MELRLYSGTSGGLTSLTRNNAPVTMAEIRLKAGATVGQDLPASYNGFLYVLEGSVQVGDVEIRTGQVGSLDRPLGTYLTSLQTTAGATGAKLMLYTGLPQNEPVVTQGPFVADSQESITRLFSDYCAGKFESLGDANGLPAAEPPVHVGGRLALMNAAYLSCPVPRLFANFYESNSLCNQELIWKSTRSELSARD